MKRISVVIPTYRRESVLLDTVRFLCELDSPAFEILIVDQSEKHEASTLEALQAWDKTGDIRWIRLSQPSITHAMNTGLIKAKGEIVLFLDDDIIPDARLISAHAAAHAEGICNIVAGQVLQPGETVRPESPISGEFQFRSGKRCWVSELMGGNFSVRKVIAIALGGFDENFVHVAYRFEAEFCNRAIIAGEKILFEPAASIRHLKARSGGTRSFGEHLSTIKPSHAVGAYYFILRVRNAEGRFSQILKRMARAVGTKYHLRRPWWIPITLIAELWGLLWALRLALGSPKLIGSFVQKETKYD